MRELVLLLVPTWLALSVVTACARVLGPGAAHWYRAVAVLVAVTAAVLLGFLGADDHYTQDGRSNAAAYPVELVALPAAGVLLAGAWWLHRRAGAPLAAVVAPLLALTAVAGLLGCIVLTTN